MKIFFDTEFTGLHKNTTLISIGLVAENGSCFYAEFNDYDKSQCDDWINDNVINNLRWNDKIKHFKHIIINKAPKRHDIVEIKDDILNVRVILKKWLEQFDKIEWVSDVCHYDFVLLVDLICEHALKLPYGVWNSACHDINQDIARFYMIDELEAFDKSREDIVEENNRVVANKVKHNALYDALVIKTIYEIILNN